MSKREQLDNLRTAAHLATSVDPTNREAQRDVARRIYYELDKAADLHVTAEEAAQAIVEGLGLQPKEISPN